jgi:hypothetical protein
VVSTTDPYGRILDFLDRRYLLKTKGESLGYIEVSEFVCYITDSHLQEGHGHGLPRGLQLRCVEI